MAEVSFNSVFLVSFVLLLQVESYYFICYNNFIFFTKALRVASTQKVNTHLVNYVSNGFYFFIFFFSMFFYKHSSLSNCSVFVISLVFMISLNRILTKMPVNSTAVNNTLYLVLPAFATFLFFIFFVKSLLVFFFFIELYSVLYYFCFLSSYNFTNQSLLKYKNGLLFLL